MKCVTMVLLSHCGKDDDERWYWLTLSACRSLAKHSKHPVVVLATPLVSEEFIEKFERNGFEVIVETPIYTKEFWNQYELTKIRAWRRTEYDKVLLVDADSYASENYDALFDFPTLTCQETYLTPEVAHYWSPVYANKLVFEPNIKDYNEMIDLILYPDFDLHNGWRRWGPIRCPGSGMKANWNFNGGWVSQGLLYYYYGLVKKQITFTDTMKVGHLGEADDKWSMVFKEPHRTIYSELGTLNKFK